MGPVFRSPQVDNGYDISDYRDIDPLFGTLADMDELIAAAHRRGIRVLLDLVLNHSSTEHRWFAASRDDPRGPYGDFYHWQDPAPGGGPPNNWWSFFSIPAWTWCPERGQYYLNLFAPEQADLNWANREVRREMAEIANFWLDRQVDGFRMDVINLISKAPGYPSIPDGGTPRGFFIDGPDALRWIQEFRSSLRDPDATLLVGETPGTTPESLRSWTAREHRALDMVISFEHVQVDHSHGSRWNPVPFAPQDLARILAEQQQALSGSSWPSLYAGNHDQPRVVSRFGDDRHFRRESAIACAALFTLLRGTPIIYQGDEIAMANFPLESPEDVQDVETRNAYQALLEAGVPPEEAFARVRVQARDNARTPMQWTSGPAAGFIEPTGSTGASWFPVNPDYRVWNVAAQRTAAEAREPSVLGAYRELLALRRRHQPLTSGLCTFPGLADLAGQDSPVIVFQRGGSGSRELPEDSAVERATAPSAAHPATSVMTIVINFSSSPAPVPDAVGLVLPRSRRDAVFATHQDATATTLHPWEVVVVSVP